MTANRTILITLAGCMLLAAGCAGRELYLLNAPGRGPDARLSWSCLNAAYLEIAAGRSSLTPEEEQALGGRDVTKFLWWGSLAGPRPVVNRAGNPSEASSLVAYPWTESLVSKRYVLCLLRNGYQWPEDRLATARAPLLDSRFHGVWTNVDRDYFNWWEIGSERVVNYGVALSGKCGAHDATVLSEDIIDVPFGNAATLRMSIVNEQLLFENRAGIVRHRRVPHEAICRKHDGTYFEGAPSASSRK